MNNEEYVRRLGQLYNEVMSLRKDEDYVINQSQMEKFIDVLDFFRDMEQRSNGKVDEIELTPREEIGGITASFIVFHIYGENIANFCRVVSHCSAFGIDATLDNKVCISVTIPEVFKHK